MAYGGMKERKEPVQRMDKRGGSESGSERGVNVGRVDEHIDCKDEARRGETEEKDYEGWCAKLESGAEEETGEGEKDSQDNQEFGGWPGEGAWRGR